MIKINKPLISGIENKTYQKGRGDKLRIELIEGLIEPLQKLFKDLEFSKEVLLDFDMYILRWEGFIIFIAKKQKFIFIQGKKTLNLIFDTSISKKEFMKTIENIFHYSNNLSNLAS